MKHEKRENSHEFQCSSIIFCLLLSFQSQFPFYSFFQIHEQIALEFSVITEDNHMIKSNSQLFHLASLSAISYPRFSEFESTIPSFYSHFFSLLFSHSNEFIKFVYYLIIDVLFPLIKKCSLESHQFNLLFLFQLYHYQLDYILLEEKVILDGLLPKSIFISQYCCFEKPIPQVVILRKLSFECFFLFYPKISEHSFFDFFYSFTFRIFR
jgi:hypothetical protein